MAKFLYPRTYFSIILGLGLIASNSGCSSTSQVNQNSESGEKVEQLDRAIVTDFADNVVVPTYQQLVQQSASLLIAVQALVKNPTEGNLKTAREAWKATRVPWEQSETFTFGPATSLGYDGDLDDWPVNETDVKGVLKSQQTFNQDSVKSLQTTQKGFHTIEYLLFGENNDRKVSDLSKRDLEYLEAITVAFNQTAQALNKSWSEGVNNNPPYREVLATAGESGNTTYPTPKAALEEIVQGIIGCLDEVANEKIGEPLKTKETIGLESRFSHNSLNDFKNNLRSVENAYLGKSPDTNPSGKSLSDLIAQSNPDLDKQVKQELQASLDALDAIPEPVEANVTNAEALTKMETAQKSILQLFSTFEEKVLPIVQSS